MDIDTILKKLEEVRAKKWRIHAHDVLHFSDPLDYRITGEQYGFIEGYKSCMKELKKILKDISL